MPRLRQAPAEGQIRHRTMAEFALEQLREAIILGELPAGTPLRLDELARGLAKEVYVWRKADDPLLYVERRDYLEAIQDVLAAVEEARVVLCRARQRLREVMDIPVFHDDQHGTAIIASAGLINALHLTKRTMKTAKPGAETHDRPAATHARASQTIVAIPPEARRSTTAALLKHAPGWTGDDLGEVIAIVTKTRTKTRF